MPLLSCCLTWSCSPLRLWRNIPQILLSHNGTDPLAIFPIAPRKIAGREFFTGARGLTTFSREMSRSLAPATSGASDELSSRIQDEYEEVSRAELAVRVCWRNSSSTNRLRTLFFQIRFWSGPCGTSTTSRLPSYLAITARIVTAATNTVATWCGIIDTSAAYRSDLNARTASITCASVRTCGRIYARSIRIVSSTASTSPPTRGSLGRNTEVIETNRSRSDPAFSRLEN